MRILLFIIPFVIGCLLALSNYMISNYFYKKKPDSYVVASVLRQIISVSYLVLLYLISMKLKLNISFVLIGGALGVTLPSFFLTARLLSNKKDKKEDKNG